MTRFMITLEEGVSLVWKAFDDLVGGETYVKKIPSMKVTDLAHVIAPNAKHEIIGIRPGEKLHESLINSYELLYTYEMGDYYVILSPHVKKFQSNNIEKLYPNIKKISNMDTYSSDNVSKISKEDSSYLDYIFPMSYSDPESYF